MEKEAPRGDDAPGGRHPVAAGHALPAAPADDRRSDRDEETFARRVGTLARSGPLHRLNELASRQSWPAGRRYDPLGLAVWAVDAVIARSGLADEYDFDGLVAAVAGRARDAEPAAGPDEWAAVAEWVVRSLLGDDGDSGFTTRVGDHRDGYHVREISWQLLTEQQRSVPTAPGAPPDVRVVVTVDTTAVNLLRAGLEFDVEDAQLAQEAVLADQLRRGDLRKAEATAQAGERLSVELAAKLRETVDMTRVDFDAVDWEEAFQARAGAALAHVQGRIEQEHHLLAHLDLGTDVDDPEVRASTRTIRELLERCLERHRDLHLLLMTASDTFLAEQARQALSGRQRARVRIQLREGLLEPAAAASPERAEAVGAAFASAALGTSRTTLLRLDTMLDRLLRPANDDVEPEADTEPVELVDDADDDVDATNWAAAAAVLASCTTTPRRLSELLADAPGPAAAELVRLGALLLFDPDDRDDDVHDAASAAVAAAVEAAAGRDDGGHGGATSGGLVAVRAGGRFTAAGYTGDELWVGPADQLDGRDADRAPADRAPARHDQEDPPMGTSSTSANTSANGKRTTSTAAGDIGRSDGRGGAANDGHEVPA